MMNYDEMSQYSIECSSHIDIYPPKIESSDLSLTDDEEELNDSPLTIQERRERHMINRLSFGLVLGRGCEAWKQRIRRLWLVDKYKGIYMNCRIITSDDVVLLGDRVTLMASSGYFRKELAALSSNQNIKVNNVTGQVMDYVLDFIFTRNVSNALPLNILGDFIQACIDLQVFFSLRAISEWISHKANEENFLELWRISKKFDLPSIIAVRKVALIRFEKIPDSVLVELPYEILYYLVSRDRLNVRREETTMKRIVTWTMAALATRGKYFSSLVRMVRFGNAAVNFIPQIINSETFKPLRNYDTKMYLNHVHDVLIDIQADPIPVKYDILKHPFLRPRIPYEILFIFGGWCGLAPVANFESYDIRVNKWFQSQINGIGPRAYHGIVTFQGAIYIIGGFNGTFHLNSVVAIDPVNRNWYTRADMNESRCYVSVAVLNDQIYACGGFNGVERTASCEVYDPASNKWRLIKSMNQVRSDATCLAFNDKLYIIGGFDGYQVHRSGEVYDPSTDTWTLIAEMSIARSGLSSIVWDKSFLVIGGNNGINRESSVEIYNPSINEWRSGPSMITSRSNFASAVLEDNLFVVGGFDGESTTELCEKLSLKDLPESQWLPVWPIPSTRSALSACVMSDLPNAIEFSWLRREGGKGNKSPDS